MNKEISNNELYNALPDYEPNEDIFSDDEFKIYKIKKIIDNLDPTDKKIFLMYVELGNQSDLARRLNVSAPTINRKIIAIKNKIKSQL